MCPHKRTFALSDGLIGDDMDKDRLWVFCPFHKRSYTLNGEDAGKCSNDENVSIATFPVEEREDAWVYLKLPPVEELDAVMGTKKWTVKKEEMPSPYKKLDRKLKGLKGRKAFGDSHLPNGMGEKKAAQAITAGGSGGIDW